MIPNGYRTSFCEIVENKLFDMVCYWEVPSELSKKLPIKEQIEILKSSTCAYLNQAACKELNLEKEELIGMKLEQIISIRKSVLPFKEFILNNYEIRDKLVQVSYLDGRKFYFQESWYSQFNEDKLIGVFTVAKDVTELIISQLQLEAEQESYEAAQRVAHIGHWVLNFKLNEVTGSEEAYRIFNLKKDNTKHDFGDFLQFVHPHDRNKLGKMYHQFFANGIEYEVEHRLLLNEEIKWVREKGQTFYDKKGAPTTAIGTIQDITDNKKLEEASEQAEKKLIRSLEKTLEALLFAVESRDPYTAGHQRRVAKLSQAIAKEMGLSSQECHGIYFGALIHDIGKLAIPAELLSKPTQLTDIEFSLIKEHPKLGYDIVKNIDFLWPVKEIILQHHERLDGSGYPNGLKDKEISLAAKIVAVSDTVEAMSAHRPYRPKLELDFALEEINRNSGKLFDPEVVSLCIKLFKDKNFIF